MNHQLDIRTVLDEHARRIRRAEQHRLARDIRGTADVILASGNRLPRRAADRTGIFRFRLRLWRRRQQVRTANVDVAGHVPQTAIGG